MEDCETSMKIVGVKGLAVNLGQAHSFPSAPPPSGLASTGSVHYLCIFSAFSDSGVRWGKLSRQVVVMSGPVSHHLFISLNVFRDPDVLESLKPPASSSLSESLGASLMMIRGSGFWISEPWTQPWVCNFLDRLVIVFALCLVSTSVKRGWWDGIVVAPK